MRRPTRTTIIASLLCLASCAPDGLALMEDMRREVETHRALAEERMATFAEIVTGIALRSDVASLPLNLGDGPPLDAAQLDDSRAGNVGLVSLDHLTSTDFEPAYDPLTLAAHWLTYSRAALAGEYLDSFYPEDPQASLEDVRAPFLRLEAMRYLVVLKEFDLVLPSIGQLAPGSAGEESGSEQDPLSPKIGMKAQGMAGRYIGTAFVYDLVGPRLVGVISVGATNSSEARGPRGVLQLQIDDLRANLVQTLRNELGADDR